MKTKIFFIFLILVAIDQIIKNIFPFSVCNKNIAWSIPTAPAIFWFGWIAITAVLIHTLVKTDSYWKKIYLVLVLSGAASNIFDRIRLGCVVDYIDLKFFPVFNLADVYITVGIIFIIFNFSRFFHLSSRV